MTLNEPIRYAMSGASLFHNSIFLLCDSEKMEAFTQLHLNYVSFTTQIFKHDVMYLASCIYEPIKIRFFQDIGFFKNCF